MKVEINIDLGLSARQKRIVRNGVVAGAFIAALGVGVAVAAPIDTTWIASGQPLSATKLQGDLDGLQSQVAALTAQAGVKTVYATKSGLAAACNVSSSTSAGGSDFESACTRDSPGIFTLALKPGTFSATPVCSCSLVYATSGYPCQIGATTTTVTVGMSLQGTGLFDGDFNVICVGPR